MLSFACFWCYINFRIIGCILLLFYFPLLSSYSFPIPFTNPLIPLFSSLPIQCSQIFIKIGFLNYSIEGLGQPPSAGFYSIILQCKEFSYPYFSLTDRLIGPIYYFTTGLHGFHVLLGAFLFFITLFYIMFSSIIIYAFYFMEFPFPRSLDNMFIHSLFTSTNHIIIGLLYIISGLIGGPIGFGLPIILRLELALPGFILCPPLQYNPNITFHGIFMIPSMIMPILIGGFGNILLPLMPCSSDMIFPRLNAFSLWLALNS